jgi:hypothetical protein
MDAHLYTQEMNKTNLRLEAEALNAQVRSNSAMRMSERCLRSYTVVELWAYMWISV